MKPLTNSLPESHNKTDFVSTFSYISNYLSGFIYLYWINSMKAADPSAVIWQAKQTKLTTNTLKHGADLNSGDKQTPHKKNPWKRLTDLFAQPRVAERPCRRHHGAAPVRPEVRGQLVRGQLCGPGQWREGLEVGGQSRDLHLLLQLAEQLVTAQLGPAGDAARAAELDSIFIHRLMDEKEIQPSLRFRVKFCDFFLHFSPDNSAPPSSVCFPACYWTSRRPKPLPGAREARRTRPLLGRSARPSAGLQTGSPAHEWRGAAAAGRKTQRAPGPSSSSLASSPRPRGCGLERRGQGLDGEGHLGRHLGASVGRCTWAWLHLAAPEGARDDCVKHLRPKFIEHLRHDHRGLQTLMTECARGWARVRARTPKMASVTGTLFSAQRA